MNKKVLSVVVVICTAITVCLMIYLTSEEKSTHTDEIQQVYKINDEEKQEAKKSNEKSVDNTDKNRIVVKEEKSKESITEAENKEKTIEKVEEIKIDKDSNNGLKSKLDEGTNGSSNDIEDINGSVELEQSKSVFKVDKNTIEGKMNFKDKIKLMNITKKLSVIDYGNIKKYLESGDEYNSAKDIFRILKSRLSSKEYDEVKAILKPYIDVETIENGL